MTSSLRQVARALTRTRVGGWAACCAVLLVTACAGPGVPPGAPPIPQNRPVGASEQLPGATRPASTEPADAVVQPVAVDTNLSDPFYCPPGTISPEGTSDLKAALRKAKPGDVIQLGVGTYLGNFEITAKGTKSKPIYLCGSPDSVLNGKGHLSGYALHLQGAQNWRLDGFSVRQGLKGIMIDASSRIVLQNLVVADTGDEAVHLRDGSSDNVVRGLTIRKTGIKDAKFGEGIYVGTAQSNWCDISHCQPDRSDGNQLVGNRISYTTAEAIDIKEGTTGGLIDGNNFDGLSLTGDADSWVDVKGNDWKINDNHGQNSPKDGFQTHVILTGWGDGNVFSGNSAAVNGGSGVGFYLNKHLHNRVVCDNTVSGAAGGLANYPCQG